MNGNQIDRFNKIYKEYLSVIMENFKLESNLNACCNESYFKIMNSQKPKRINNKVYVYAQCQNCNTRWRDVFKEVDGIEYDYTGVYQSPIDDIDYEFDWCFSHFDLNKLHQDYLMVVYKPDGTNDPFKNWFDNGFISEETLNEYTKKFDYDKYVKKVKYVYEHSEINSE